MSRETDRESGDTQPSRALSLGLSPSRNGSRNAPLFLRIL
jgi:hypothetical protein